MIKRILVIALAISTTLNAQNEVDALRYSTQDNLGTARYSAMGGAFGSLGGEFSALSLNPAGIGMYQFSEFTFTPTFNLNSTKSYFNRTNTADYNTGLDIGNLGLVFTIPKGDTDWKRINIAIGWNQLTSYDRNIIIEGHNNTSSLADNILEYAQGNTIDNLNSFHGSPAFWSDLIDLENNDTINGWYANDNGSYISHISSNSYKMQAKHIQTSGGENEFVFSAGGSYNEQLYIGASIGFPSINYYENTIYSEHSFKDTINGLNGFDYQEELTTYGNGINLKFGAIFRVNESFKIGASVHSPTYYNIEETYSTLITTHFNEVSYTEDSPVNYFEYKLQTPWKANLSASTILNKNILISGDYEIIDYSSVRMNSYSYRFTDENEIISNLYQKTENIKIGAEMNIKPFILRAGYAKIGSAFAKKDFSRENFSYGLGINNGGYYFDIAYVLSQGANEHLLYSEEYISPTSLVNTNHSLIFTIGFKY
ncbi:hypothetical protein N9B89_01745 [Flavobacteriales bacterium]|nr:hypothetical protein [Flavobacteriales bacterium]